MTNCEKCSKEHDESYGSGRFCSSRCARSFTTIAKREELNKRVSETIKRNSRTHERTCEGCKETFFTTPKSKQRVCDNECVGRISQARKHLGIRAQSLLETSKRTAAKIIRRLDIGCSRCGWKEASCDIHHIKGRKIPNADAHSNLTLLCPNCHRLFHAKKIGPEDVVSFEQQFGESWKQFYFG